MKLEEVLPLSVRDLLALPGRLLGLRRTAERMRSGEAPERLYGLLNTEQLEQLVLRAIPWRSIRPNVGQGLIDAVCVAATQIGTGNVTVFIETRDRVLPRWTRDPTIVPRPTRLLPTHALASAAIPVLFPAVRVASTYYADGGIRLNTPLAPALRLGADRVLVVALRPNPAQASEAALAEQRVGDYGSPLFLFGKVLNALLLDHIDTDLARMRVMNEILLDGEKAYGPDFLARINEVAHARARPAVPAHRGRRDPPLGGSRPARGPDPAQHLGRPRALAADPARRAQSRRARTQLRIRPALLSALRRRVPGAARRARFRRRAQPRRRAVSVLHRLAACGATSSRASGC